MEKYDGSTDPNEHIEVYTTQISLYTWNDVILCRVFPTNLKGATLSWFTRLPLLSIKVWSSNCYKTVTSSYVNCLGEYKAGKGRIVENIHGTLRKISTEYLKS